MFRDTREAREERRQSYKRDNKSGGFEHQLFIGVVKLNRNEREEIFKARIKLRRQNKGGKGYDRAMSMGKGSMLKGE